METTQARLRIALLSSHLRPTPRHRLPAVAVSNCVSTTDDDCIFCKIIRGDSPAFKLYEDEVCVCILDMNPVCAGHSLIIPKSHYSSLQETPPTVVGAMCSKVPLISNAVMKATGCGRNKLEGIEHIVAVVISCLFPVALSIYVCSFNLLGNNGAAAGQVIFHTHLHIIPRKASDCLWNSESLQRRPLKLDQETHRFADQICKHLLISDESKYCQGQGSSLSAN